MEYKICTKCKQKKPETLDYFSKQKTGKNGFFSQCKECRQEFKQKYRKNAKINKLTQKRLKELLHYNPETGIWTWKVDRSNISAGERAGYIHPLGYRCICIYGAEYKSSILAFLYMEGYFPEYCVDHINRTKDDDRWSNLRHVTHMCNNRNKSIGSNNKSGITGVRFRKQNKKWVAQITNNYKKTHLGYFDTKEEAALARYKAEMENGWVTCNTISSAGNYLKLKK